MGKEIEIEVLLERLRKALLDHDYDVIEEIIEEIEIRYL